MLLAACLYASIAAAMAVVVAVAASLSGQPAMPWGWIAIGLGAGVLVAAAVRWFTSPVSPMLAAIVLDERLQLHDALSTAMAFSGRRDDPLATGQQAVAATHALPMPGKGSTLSSLPSRWCTRTSLRASLR